MCQFRLNARLPVIAAVGGAIAAIALAATPGIARAQEDGRTFEQGIIHKLMTGLGLQDPNAVQPTYEQRPPLVIPKGDTLPPPQSSGAAIANNPAWPKDPDILRAKALAKAEKNRDTFAEYEREKNPLPPDQLGPRGGPRTASRGGGQDFNYSGLPKVMSPKELGFRGSLFDTMFGNGKKEDEETARFTGEPARASLIEPPPGYQTPSPNQPYGLGKEAARPKAENSYLTKGEVNPNR